MKDGVWGTQIRWESLMLNDNMKNKFMGDPSCAREGHGAATCHKICFVVCLRVRVCVYMDIL